MNTIDSRSKIVINIKNFYFVLEFRVIGLNIKPSPPPKVNESEAKSLGVSKKFLENEFKDSLKKSTEI